MTTPTNGPPINILLVEDNLADVRLIQEMLVAIGIETNQVELAGRLEDAIRHLRATAVDLVLLDLSLPDSEHIDAVRHVRDAAPNAPIIVLTELDDDQTATRSMQLGAQDYLIKGRIDAGTLARSIRHAVERQSTLEFLRRQSRMQAVAQITTGAAHRFNSLLTVIIGNAELLGERVKSAMLFDRFIEPIVESAKFGSHLTGSLLSFCRMQPLHPKVIDSGETLRRLQLVGGATVGGTINLKVAQPTGVWPIMADDDQLQLSLNHLITNARDAVTNLGTIAIEARNLTIESGDTSLGELTPGEYVAFAVSDNGIGMTRETLNRVFEPFFTTKPEGKGVGLGLSMVHGFAHQSGGNVHVASTPGVGTTVTLILPASSEPVGARTLSARRAV